jgi:hypothetical protein
MILAGARVYYATAKDGLFFRSAGKIHAAVGSWSVVSLRMRRRFASVPILI